jgi:agmatine deiminase
MPAEWEPHAATWIAWPHNRDDWPGKFAPIPWVYTEIVRYLSRTEKVHVVVRGVRMKHRVADQLDAVGVDLDAVRFFKAPTDRAWVRDSGPTFVVKDESASNPDDPLGVVDWKFNGWSKYDNHRRDDRLAGKLAQSLKLRHWVPTAQQGGRRVRVVMEGGAIDVNGRGSLFTTEECLLGDVQARNPGLDRAAMERILNRYLGSRHVIWLGTGIDGDDTHGHVDDLARFVGPRTVVAAVESCVQDPNHEPLQDNLRRLEKSCDQDGQALDVVELPMPRRIAFDGQRLPASYANFYLANGLVLVPTFNDPADRAALDILAKLFPDRQVVGIHSVDLVLGLGTLHCLSQQQPAEPDFAGLRQSAAAPFGH